MSRYLRGWIAFARAYRMARRKKHGAGAQPRKLALRTAACMRFIVDGQHRTPPRFPRWFPVRKESP